jgi:subtilisin family serine protease
MRPVKGIAVAVALVLGGAPIAWGSEPALVLHVTEFLEEGCEAIDPDTMSCESIVVEGDSGDLQNVYVLTSDIGALAAVQFGIEYESTVHVLGWTACHGAMGIGTPDWPDSGEGMALAFDPQYPTAPDSLVVLGYFVILDGSSGVMSITADPRTERAEYADADAQVFVFEPLLLGSVDVNGGGHGSNPCGLSRGGDTGGDAADGGESVDGGGDPSDSGHGLPYDPLLVYAMFVDGVVRLPEGTISGTIQEADIASAAVESVLTAHIVVRVTKAFPSFDPANVHGTSRTGEIVRLADLSDIYTLEVADSLHVQSLISALSALYETIYVEADVTTRPCDPVYPNDTYFNPPFEYQWGLLNTAQQPNFLEDFDIDAPEAWCLTTGDPANRIAIVDGGIYEVHPDIAGKVSGDSGIGEWGDHGLSVACVASARTNNSEGVAGVDWLAQLISQRVDDVGIGGIYDAIMEALLVDDARILNCSWDVTGYSETLRLAFANAYKLNAISVAAIGNDYAGGCYTAYPACFGDDRPEGPWGFGHGVIAVGTADFDGTWYHHWTSCGDDIDVAAPAHSVFTCEYSIDEGGESLYFWKTGSSMAAPHAAGAASLLLSYNPNLYNDDIESLLEFSATDMVESGVGWDPYTGYGLINVRSAIGLLRHPYAFQQRSATGGTIVDSSPDYYLQKFVSAHDNLPDGYYWVKRHVVETTVDFSDLAFLAPPFVWGRGAAMAGGGWNRENPNFGLGWCRKTGTITETTARLLTYIYEVYDFEAGGQGEFLGWFPTDHNHVSWKYSVLGQVSMTPVQKITTADVPATVGLWLVGASPAAGGVTFGFRLPRRVDARLQVFDVGGRLVRTLLDGVVGPGEYGTFWDGLTEGAAHVAPGVYFTRLSSGVGNHALRVLLVR